METMRNWLLLLISAAGLAHAEPPARIEITYEMTRNGSPMAEVVERLEHSGGHYQLTETWEGKGLFALLGSAKRVSQGGVSADRLWPREFSDERSGRDTARAWFDWTSQTLTMQYKGPRQTQSLPPDAQDRLSFLVALSYLPGRAESASYTIADGRGLSRHEYRVSGRERIKTPAGEFDTVKVARHSGKNPRQSSELWLAASRGNLPVRLLVVEKDGTRYEQVAIRISTP